MFQYARIIQPVRECPVVRHKLDSIRDLVANSEPMLLTVAMVAICCVDFDDVHV